MSDRSIFPGLHRDQHTNVTITEKRAPTDESVRLLREMEDKAREQVYASVVLDSNGFKGLALFSEQPWERVDVATIIYEFNGHKERCEVRLDQMLQIEERIDLIVKTLGEHIAQKTLVELHLGLEKMFKRQ